MKCLLLADNRSDLIDSLEPILKHWGYRVLVATKVDQIAVFLKESEPALALIGSQFLAEPDLSADKAVQKQLSSAKTTLVELVLDTSSPPKIKPVETLSTPIDIFALFSFIQKYVEKHPRQNLRLPLRLPGMYCAEGEDYVLASVLSLSMRGLFFKAATRLKKGDKVSVVIPLLGFSKEVEVDGTILYVIQPDAANNFMQGFGVGFDDLSEEYQIHLHHFIEERFLSQVSSSRPGVGEFSKQHLSH